MRLKILYNNTSFYQKIKGIVTFGSTLYLFHSNFWQPKIGGRTDYSIKNDGKTCKTQKAVQDEIWIKKIVPVSNFFQCSPNH